MYKTITSNQLFSPIVWHQQKSSKKIQDKRSMTNGHCIQSQSQSQLHIHTHTYRHKHEYNKVGQSLYKKNKIKTGKSRNLSAKLYFCDYRLPCK